jgi:hypothetical protein
VRRPLVPSRANIRRFAVPDAMIAETGTSEATYTHSATTSLVPLPA